MISLEKSLFGLSLLLILVFTFFQKQHTANVSVVGKSIPAQIDLKSNLTISPQQSTKRVSLNELANEYQQTLRELFADHDQYNLNTDSPKFIVYNQRGWQLLSNWSCQYLNQNPNTDKVQLTAAIKEFDHKAQRDFAKNEQYPLDFSVVQLESGARGAFVISASWAWVGTFFIIARNEQGDWRQVWTIKDIAETNFAERNQLGYWAYNSPAFHDGPLAGNVAELPHGNNKHARFYVNAITNPVMGDERPAQLSVWEWDGNAPQPIFIKQYQTTFDAYQVNYSNGRLVMGTKESLKTFFTCGSCSEPEGYWTLAVTATGIEDLGHRFKDEDMQLIDELFYRVLAKKDAGELADSKVIQELLNTIEAENPGQSEDEPDQHSLVMMIGYKRKVTRGFTTIDIQVDPLPNYRFTIIKKNGRPFVSKVSKIASE